MQSNRFHCDLSNVLLQLSPIYPLQPPPLLPPLVGPIPHLRWSCLCFELTHLNLDSAYEHSYVFTSKNLAYFFNIISNSINLPENITIPFFLLLNEIALDLKQIICFSVDGPLGRAHALAIVLSATITAGKGTLPCADFQVLEQKLRNVDLILLAAAPF